MLTCGGGGGQPLGCDGGWYASLLIARGTSHVSYIAVAFSTTYDVVSLFLQLLRQLCLVLRCRRLFLLLLVLGHRCVAYSKRVLLLPLLGTEVSVVKGHNALVNATTDGT